VTPERRRIATALGLATIAFLVVLAVRPVAADRIVAGYVLGLTAIALGALLRLISAAAAEQPASQFERLLTRAPEEQVRPPELVRVEREITLGTSSAGHVHLRLLPLLREVATAKLGLDLERRPAQARGLLGDDAWELLRPDRPAPVDRTAPGLPLRRIRELVDTLEAL
jgi:hypothetical protein